MTCPGYRVLANYYRIGLCRPPMPGSSLGKHLGMLLKRLLLVSRLLACRPPTVFFIFPAKQVGFLAASPDQLEMLSGDTGGGHLQRDEPARRQWKGGH